MNYRSTADLSNVIRENIHLIPRSVDLVVGIPRSGTLAANIIALNLNLKMCDITTFLSNSKIQHGDTRRPLHSNIATPSDASHVLLVDDSINSGLSMAQVKEAVFTVYREIKVTFCAIYALPTTTNLVDVYFEVLGMPRSFEWNLLHRPCISNYCIDIDGVICADPTDKQNDDGPAYLHFLQNAVPLIVPTYPVGHLVTSRLEKYRGETESWLAKHGVKYKELHMLDLPDAESRTRLGCHASFKATVYQKIADSTLFVESEPNQAITIASKSGKPSLSFKTQFLYEPGLSYQRVKVQSRGIISRLARFSRRTLKLLKLM